ncbi:helix-turn-helix domain-containing protein [Streptomonospora sp. PA3]|nr:helix-turn-helix domain-containing protein [Streptomonospora sp. PA3]
MAEVSSVSIDQEADAAYLGLAEEPVARSVEHGSFVADYGSDGRVLGIEVLTLRQAPTVSAIMDAVGPVDDAARKRIVSFIDQIRGLEGSPGTSPSVDQARLGDQTADLPETRLDETRSFTIAEVATIMRVSRMTIYRMIHSGTLPAVRVGRMYRVPAPAVDDYLRGAETRLEAMR